MKSEVLLTAEQIQTRIKHLALQIEEHYKGKQWMAVVVYNGAMFFASDLLKNIQSDFKITGVQASSYHGGFKSEELSFLNNIDCTNQHVLIIDDIYDTGKTLNAIVRSFREKQALTVTCCVLLSKDAPRINAVDIGFIGFNVPNKFVYGYGLDIDDRFRNQQNISMYNFE